MNQISIGNASSGWLILSGESVSAPFKGASLSPVCSSSPMVEDEIILSLEGTPTQISTGLAALEKARQRAALYDRAGCPSPQYLRVQPLAGGEFFTAPLSDLRFEFNPDGYNTHQSGSLIVTLHFTRPNAFDGSQVELPLTNRSGEDVTGGIPLFNHTDYHTAHDSSVLIKPGDIESSLPAPLRIELENTFASGVLRDLYVGLYHHPACSDDDLFFLQINDFTGGTQLYDTSAVNDYYCRFSFGSPGWTSFGYWTLSNDQVNNLAGRSYRPILLFFNAHAYTDLYLKIKLQKGANVLWESDPVYADPSFQYLLFPPVQIPPHRLLGELIPHHVDLHLYGQHETSGSYQVDVDQLHLLPLDSAASFLGFYDMNQADVLIDDSFRGLHNVHYSALGSETIAHLRQGGPLLLYPGEYNRLFFVQVNGSNQVFLWRTVSLSAFYRKRVRML